MDDVANEEFKFYIKSSLVGVTKKGYIISKT